MSTQHLNESLGRVESSIARLQDKALKALDLAESFSRENKRLRALNAELLAALEVVNDRRGVACYEGEDDDVGHCPFCGQVLHKEHANTCEFEIVAAAIKKAREETA